MDLTPLLQAAQLASRELAAFGPAATDALLRDLAAATVAETDFLLAENARDLALMPEANPNHDRLRLTAERLRGMADDLRNVAALPSPLGQVISQTERPNGLRLRKGPKIIIIIIVNVVL